MRIGNKKLSKWRNIENWFHGKNSYLFSWNQFHGKNSNGGTIFFCLPIGTLEPVAKWHSCRLRVRIGRCPNISTLGGISLFPFPPPDFPTDFPAEEEDFPESPMSMSRMNHFRGLVSTIGEDGVDWIAVNRSTREPNP